MEHIEIAKNLFLSWDDDGSGILEVEELINPLLALGLASDADFAEQLLQHLDPHAGKPGHDELSIQLTDFIKIFKPDRLQEKMVSFIQ